MFEIVNTFNFSSESRFKGFGSDCRIRVAAGDRSKEQSLIALGITEVQRIEQKFSRFLPTSILSQINQNAATAPVIIDEETTALFKLAELCYQESEGLFDITSAPLSELWKNVPDVPSEKELAIVLERVGFSHLKFSDREVFFTKPGMAVDLGGLGKEYAVDRVFNLLIEGGASEVIVNFGGDLRVLSNSPLAIGVQSPLDKGEIIGELKISRGSIATSGDYVRNRLVGGKLRSHIINPRSGQPCESFSSVSVVHDTAVLAGIATTTAILLGDEMGLRYLEEAGLPYLVILKASNKITTCCTKGFLGCDTSTLFAARSPL